jgi:hypothetical protein
MTETNQAPKKRTLVEITEALLQNLWQIDLEYGEVTDELAEELDRLEEAQARKIDSILMVVDDYEAKAASLIKRADTLAKHAKRLRRESEWLKKYVIHSMEATKLTKIECEDHPLVSIRLNPPSVVVDNEEEFLKDPNSVKRGFVREKVRRLLHKTGIRQAMERGEEVEGAAIIRRKKLVF